MGCGQEKKDNYYGELINIRKHDEITYSFDFKSDEITHWNEGDASMLIFVVDDTMAGKKFSYASLPEDGFIRFTTRIKKDCSEYKKTLKNLVKGEFVRISQPVGNLELKRENRPILLLSNGIAITAVRSLIKSFMSNQDSIPKMIQFNVDSKSDIYKEEFDSYKAETDKFQSYYLSNRNSFYGMLNHDLKILLRNYPENPYVYIVGSKEFVSENITRLLALGIKETDIIVDEQSVNGCCRTK